MTKKITSDSLRPLGPESFKKFRKIILDLLDRDWVFRWSGLGILMLLVLAGSFVFTYPDGNLHVIACDVGQGDAILIQYGNNQVLVDGGPGEAVIGCLSRYIPIWDRRIEMIVLTHSQADHYSGLTAVLERFKVEKVVSNGVEGEGDDFRKFSDAVFKEGVGVHLPRRGDVLSIGDLYFDVLWPEKKIGSESVFLNPNNQREILGSKDFEEDVNESSVVLQLTFGEFDVLLTGDMGFDSEDELLRDQVIRDIEVLKVGHHGSRYASSENFLGKTDPEIAIISVGRNSFGHPTDETLERLEKAGAKVIRTDQAGDVEVISDGKRFWLAR